MRELPKRDWDLVRVLSQTSVNQDYVIRCESFVSDSKREERLEKQCCRSCFYMRSRVGGTVMTSRICGGIDCSEVVRSSNTCVDELCRECGIKYDLCVRCGGDMEDRVRRSLAPRKKTKKPNPSVSNQEG